MGKNTLQGPIGPSPESEADENLLSRKNSGYDYSNTI